MGAQLGDDVVFADVGDLVSKPRSRWHTFWNAKDEPCRILEIISPGGFEESSQSSAAAPRRPMPARAMAWSSTLESIPRLCEEHGLTFAMPGD